MIHAVLDRLLRPGRPARPERVRLPELTYRLCSQVEALRRALPDRTVLPTAVLVRCSPADYGTLAPARHQLAALLAAHMRRHAETRGWLAGAGPWVSFTADPGAPDGGPLLEPTYPRPAPPHNAQLAAAFRAVIAGSWPARTRSATRRRVAVRSAATRRPATPRSPR